MNCFKMKDIEFKVGDFVSCKHFSGKICKCKVHCIHNRLSGDIHYELNSIEKGFPWLVITSGNSIVESKYFNCIQLETN